MHERESLRSPRMAATPMPQRGRALRVTSTLSGGEGGESGIRTHGTLTGTPDFESGSFGHSDISPPRKMPNEPPPVNATSGRSPSRGGPVLDCGTGAFLGPPPPAPLPKTRAMISLYGHFHTLAPYVFAENRPPKQPPAVPWAVDVPDSHFGRVRLTGLLDENPSAKTLLLIVHGLGGHVESHYVLEPAWAAPPRGDVVLAPQLARRRSQGRRLLPRRPHRGSPRNVARRARTVRAHFHHGVLVGGHVVLRYGAEDMDPRVHALASICSPLDLDRGATYFDNMKGGFVVYRRHVLDRLKEMYVAVAKRRPAGLLPASAAVARGISRIRAWDNAIIAPRYGFASAEDYYARASATFAPSEHRAVRRCSSPRKPIRWSPRT